MIVAIRWIAVKVYWLNFFSKSDNTIFYSICHSKFLLILFEKEISKKLYHIIFIEFFKICD